MKFIYVILLLPIFGFGQSKIEAPQNSHSFPTYYTLSNFHADEITLSDELLLEYSENVIEGLVIETSSFYENEHIFSKMIIKDSLGDSYSIKLCGGNFEDHGSFNSGELYLNKGEYGIFYLKKNATGEWIPSCGTQSFKSLKPLIIYKCINSSASLSSLWANGNAHEYITITGDNFGQEQGSGYVSFDNGNGYYDANTAQTFDYSVWNENEITVKVPQAFSNRVKIITNSGNVIETTDSLHIGYNLDSDASGVYGHNHLHNQVDGGHKFYLNSLLFSVSERKEAVERTLDDFVCKTGINIVLAEEETTLGWSLGDGQNTISFDSDLNTLSPGTVGYCNTLWSSCIYAGETFYYVNEMDVVINSSFEYDFGTGNPSGSLAKFSYVLMHELGHAFRLGHVNELGESMYPSVTNMPSNSWYERDTISHFDKLGVIHSLNKASSFSFSACGLSNMVPLIQDCENNVSLQGNQTINLNSGWNIFSTFIIPQDPNIESIFSTIVENIIIVKDNLGNAYIPSFNFNGVGEINYQYGYDVKTNISSELILVGQTVEPENSPITISQGWNTISYLRNLDADLVLVFQDIVENIIIVKDNMGAAYLPMFDYNGIGDMTPGKGYNVKSSNQVSLQYISNDASY